MTRKKQAEIPGTERESDPELDAAAADVYEICAERLESQEREKAARTKLLDLMKAKHIVVYVYEDGEDRFDVTRQETEKVSVKKAKNRRVEEAAE